MKYHWTLKNNRTNNLYLIVTLEGHSAISLCVGVNVDPENWDSVRERLIQIQRPNEMHAHKEQMDLLDKVVRAYMLAELNGDRCTPDHIKDAVANKEQRESIRHRPSQIFLRYVKERKLSDSRTRVMKRPVDFLDNTGKWYDEINYNDAYALKEVLEMEGKKTSSIKAYMSGMSALWNWAKKIGLVDTQNPFDMVTIKGSDETEASDFLHIAEESEFVETVRAQGDANLTKMVLIQLITGCAYVDIPKHPHKHLRSDNGHTFFVYKRQKTGREAKVILIPEEFKIIMGMLGDPIQRIPLSRYNKLIDTAWIRSWYWDPTKRITSHSLRKTFATRKRANGYSLEAVARMLGDSEKVTENVYGKIDIDRLIKEKEEL